MKIEVYSCSLFHKNIFFKVDYVFPKNAWPSWAVTDMWAPEIHFVQDGYKIYFTAMSKTTGNTRKVRDNEITINKNLNSGAHAIGVAISANKTNPFGPYFDFGKPIIEDSSGVIDAHWFRDPK